MMKLATFCFVIVFGSTYGHNGNQRNVQNLRDDGHLQADLMPQELQSEYAANADAEETPLMFDQHKLTPEFLELPLRPLLPPQPRIRRSVFASEIGTPETPDPPTTSIAEQVRQYSRVVACFVLVVSAAIEVVVYIIEAYQVESA